MLTDYHVHLDKVSWSMETIKGMCQKAEKEGVDKIGIVLHTKVLQEFKPLYSHIIHTSENHKKLTFNRNIGPYIELLECAKAKGYPVYTGIEVCYFPETEQFLKKRLEEYPFDFAIGSVHLVNGMHYKTAVEHYGSERIAGRIYYETVLKAAQSGLFNIIGHIEVARREGIPGISSYPDILERICSIMSEGNCAVEINTKWLTKHDFIVPDRYTLSYMADKKINLVFGSDAHHQDRIGFARDTAVKAIREAGYRDFFSINN